MEEPSSATLRAIWLHICASIIALCILFFTIGLWAATAEVSGAVIAFGNVVSDSDLKKIQHPRGGVIAELNVRNGDRVKAGDVLLKLDETVALANLGIVTKAIDEAVARQARLQAERDGAVSVVFPNDLLTRSHEVDVEHLIKSEQAFFEIRREARRGQEAQLLERTGQLKEQIQGLTEQIAAKKTETSLIYQELEGVRSLYSKNLVPVQRVTALERDAARLEGEKGALVSAIAQVKGKITETDLQRLQIEQDLRTSAGKELSDIRGRLSELKERKIAVEDDLRRVDIRAPQQGIVHQLSVHTLGGVIMPGDTIMNLVPYSDRLLVEAKISPHDIDQVAVGQSVILRLSAFQQRTTPEILGDVVRISADATHDDRTGKTFYTARIAMPEREVARLGELKLTPGMPVEAFLQTQKRTVLTYFTKPLSDQVARAFRSQ